MTSNGNSNDPMQDIINEMAALCALSDMTPRELKNPNNKWLVRSAFQKYIRRGREDDAIRMAEYLFAFDEKYAWNALQTVLIEDVGIGDLSLMTYGAVCNLKSVRDKMPSSTQLFASMVVQACGVPKSRACCELSLGADLTTASMQKQFASLTEDELLHVMKTGADVPQYVACKVQRQRLRGCSDDAMAPTMEIICDATENLPFEATRAALFNFERTVDSMNLALFPVLMHYYSDSMYAVEDVIPEEVDIMSVTSAAFDMHVMQGKRAIKAFWKELCLMDLMFKEIPDDDAVKAVGSLVFIVEGGQVDARLHTYELADLKAFQDTNFPPGYGLPETIPLKPALDIVRKNIPLLNEKRKWSAK